MTSQYKIIMIALFVIGFGFLAYSMKLEKDCEEDVTRYLGWYSDANSKIDRLEKELSLIRPPRLISMERIVGKTIFHFAIDTTNLNRFYGLNDFVFVHLPFKSISKITTARIIYDNTLKSEFHVYDEVLFRVELTESEVF